MQESWGCILESSLEHPGGNLGRTTNGYIEILVSWRLHFVYAPGHLEAILGQSTKHFTAAGYHDTCACGLHVEGMPDHIEAIWMPSWNRFEAPN